MIQAKFPALQSPRAMGNERAAYQQGESFKHSHVSTGALSDQAFLEPQRLLSAVDEILADEICRWRKHRPSLDRSIM